MELQHIQECMPHLVKLEDTPDNVLIFAWFCASKYTLEEIRLLQTCYTESIYITPASHQFNFSCGEEYEQALAIACSIKMLQAAAD
jgi:hypothetical protein